MQLWQQLINTLILSAVNEALPSSRCPQWQLRVRVLHPIQAQRISLALLIAELQQPLGALPSFFQPLQTPATKAKEEQTLPEPEQAGEGQGSDLCRENLRKNRDRNVSGRAGQGRLLSVEGARCPWFGSALAGQRGWCWAPPARGTGGTNPQTLQGGSGPAQPGWAVSLGTAPARQDPPVLLPHPLGTFCAFFVIMALLWRLRGLQAWTPRQSL